MSNTYRATSEAGVAAFEEDVFERDLTVIEEKDALDSGLLELVPRTYRVLSDNYAHPQGEEFDAAFRIETEAALISGGHIKRVDKQSAEPTEPTTESTEPRRRRS